MLRGPFQADRYNQPKYYIGDSFDVKPTNNVNGGDRFIETDTKDQYIYDTVSWHKEIEGGA